MKAEAMPNVKMKALIRGLHKGNPLLVSGNSNLGQDVHGGIWVSGVRSAKSSCRYYQVLPGMSNQIVTFAPSFLGDLL